MPVHPAPCKGETLQLTGTGMVSETHSANVFLIRQIDGRIREKQGAVGTNADFACEVFCEPLRCLAPRPLAIPSAASLHRLEQKKMYKPCTNKISENKICLTFFQKLLN